MSNITRKIVAVVTALTVSIWLAGPAFGATVEELQAQIDALMAQLKTLQEQLSTLQGAPAGVPTACTGITFDRNLAQGMSGNDVKCLQALLNQSTDTQVATTGAGSSGSETTYFGPLTKAAVVKFQEKYASEILATYGLTTGTGFVGTTTKAKLNALLGGVPAGCECTAWTDGACGAGTCTATQRQQTRTCTPAACAAESQCVADTTCAVVPTKAEVSLAADTPAAAQVALNAQDVIFTKIKFTAGSTAYTISKILVMRSGVSKDTDVSAIKLYDGITQLGSAQALNTNTHKATFSSLAWEVPANSTKVLTIKGSIAASGTATVGDSIKLGISAATDLTTTATVEGTFPVFGSTMTIAGISVGNLDVTKLTTPATNPNMLSGSIDQEIACWQFYASTTEGFNVHSVKVTHIGSATKDDVKNIKLKVAGAQIGSTVANPDASNAITFDLSSSPLSINAGSSKNVCAYADIASGIWTSRTVIFEITQYTDVVAYGANSGGVTTITYCPASTTCGTAFARQAGNTMTIGQGTLQTSLDAAQNPSQQTYVKGTTNRLMTALKFSTGSTEGVRVTEIKLTRGGTGSATDISNVTLWDGTTQIAGPASVIGSYVTFGLNTVGWDTTGVFDLEASKTKTLLVKADIPSGATATRTMGLSIAAATDVKADGLSSKYDLVSTAVTGTAAGTAHLISNYGSLTASLAATSPVAQTYVKGSTGKEFTRINLTAGSGEDIVVTGITIKCYQGSASACTTANGVTNVKILKSDGTQFGSTYAAPTASASFSASLTVKAAETETLKVVADIPSTSNATSVRMNIDLATVTTDLTSSGVSSATEITEEGSATGNLMVFGQGALTVSAAATPADQSIIIGGTEVTFVNLVMAAGTAEDIRITKVAVTRSRLSGAEGSSTDMTNIALYEGTTRLTAKKGWDTTDTTKVTFTASDFLNSMGIDITKGQQKTIAVKTDIPSTAVDTHIVAMGVASSTDSTSILTATTSDVTFVGLLSNTTPDTLVSYTSGLGGVNLSQTGAAAVNYVTLAQRGTLVVDVNPDTPATTTVAVSIEGIGATNVAYLKIYLKALLEEVNVKNIVVRTRGYATTTNPADFASVSIFDGDTQLGTAQTLSNNASTTFNFAAENYWKIPIVGVKYLTVKANLNGIRSVYGSGAVTGDVPKICIQELTAEGVSSGLAPTGGVSAELCGNIMVIRQTKPTVALASPTSQLYGAGTKELINWTVAADARGDLNWKKVVFDVSGGIVIGTTSYTVGSYTQPGGEWLGRTVADGIYMSTTTTGGGALSTQLIATSSMQVWDADTNTQITTGQITVDQNTATGTARTTFVASEEQVVAAGATKTYKLVGSILRDGVAGSSLMTKIENRSTSTTTDTYANAAAGTGVTFVWSDKSGGSYATHSLVTGDWTNDFKVPGLPTAAKTLSK